MEIVFFDPCDHSIRRRMNLPFVLNLKTSAGASAVVSGGDGEIKHGVIIYGFLREHAKGVGKPRGEKRVWKPEDAKFH